MLKLLFKLEPFGIVLQFDIINCLHLLELFPVILEEIAIF